MIVRDAVEGGSVFDAETGSEFHLVKVVDGERADSLAEARKRLMAWVDDIVIGRYERPVYPNPSALKSDLRVVLAALDNLSADTLAQLEEDLRHV